VNDERIALVRFRDRDLFLASESLDNLPAEVPVRIVQPIFRDKKIQMPPGEITLPRSVAIDLIRRHKVSLISAA